jgi:hypothetical protein
LILTMQRKPSGQDEYKHSSGNAGERWPRAAIERFTKFYHLDQSLFCNWFEPPESQHDISRQFALSEFRCEPAFLWGTTLRFLYRQ